MRPFYQLFIIHFIGSIGGIAVIAGYYDVFSQTFALFDFSLAFWLTAAVLVCYAIYLLAFCRNDTSKHVVKTISKLQSRLLLSGILLSFWLPAVLNLVDTAKPAKESRILLTTNKRSKEQ